MALFAGANKPFHGHFDVRTFRGEEVSAREQFGVVASRLRQSANHRVPRGTGFAEWQKECVSPRRMRARPSWGCSDPAQNQYGRVADECVSPRR